VIKKVFMIEVVLAVTFAFGTFLGCTTASQEANPRGDVTKPSDEPLDLQQGASARTDLNVHRDDKFPFTIAYPKDWESVAPMNPATRLSLVNRKPDGNMSAGFNIVAALSPELKNRTPAQQKDGINEYLNVAVEELKATGPNVKVVQRGETKLSGQAAYYVLMEGQTKQGAEVKVIRLLQIRTVHAENGYDLTFSCEADNYDSLLPVFKLIASSFKITPSP
jgi:hypothetical protein